jgi:YVTN family beta-propeller protein
MTPRILPAAACAALAFGCQTTAGPTTPTASTAAILQPTMQASKLIPVGKTPHGMWAVQGFVYNANIGVNSISVIDTKTDTVVKTLPVDGGTPGYVHDFRNGKYAMVVDTKRGALMLFDPMQDHKLLQTVSLGKGPDHTYEVDDDTVIVSLTGENKMVQLKFGEDLTKAPERKDYAVGSNPGEHRAISANGGWGITPNAGDNNTSLVNLQDGSVKTLTDGNAPAPVGIGTIAGTAIAAIVGNTASNTVTLFGIPAGDKTTLTNTGLAPTEMQVDPNLHRAFISMAGSNDLAIVDYEAKTLVQRVGMGDRPVHVYNAPKLQAAGQYALTHDDADLSGEIWVGNDNSGSVTVVDGATGRVKATVGTDQGHHKMAFWGTKAYVSNIKANNVAVIDRTMIK